MEETLPHGPDARPGRVIILFLTAVSALAPLWAEHWKWLSSLGSALLGGAGLWFTWKANGRASEAERRAIAAEKRAAEAHEWNRAEREQADKARDKAREARLPVEAWVTAMRGKHELGQWFPFEKPDWEMAHAAARLGLIEVDDSLAAYTMGRARIL